MDEYLPGSASLVDMVDQQILVILRDGRHFYGHLRTYDQFANLVLHDTIERIFYGSEYGDQERGTFLVRGENVVLLGQVEQQIEFKQIEQDLLDRYQDHQRKKQLDKKAKQQKLYTLGFCEDGLENDAY
ncbi:Sm-like ribonucleoprotein [Gorgonomyces haynaldii]|nr:Sm-like ribonucleoprotein [Gorgonomyces haynaldii]